jgi:preprotein translocase subunit SecA
MIQHSMITKSIERAQKKVEENNFGIRKRLLEYDDVMNTQREVIYSKRRNALFGEKLAIDISNMTYDLCEQIVSDFQEAKSYQEFTMELLKTLAIESPVTEKEFLSMNHDTLTQKLFEAASKNYKDKTHFIAEKTYPIIKEVYEKETRYENIAIPITDGVKTMQVVANLKKAYEDQGREVMISIEKGITLAIIDDSWKDHLREMDELKQSVQSATYEQKDPLLIYKFESFELFKTLMQKVNREIVSFLIKGKLPLQSAENVREARAPKGIDSSKLKTERTDMLSQAHRTGEQAVTQPVRVEKKVGRNDPCPCGSGKKYKQCHGKIG